jgi:hypothetical protein
MANHPWEGGEKVTIIIRKIYPNMAINYIWSTKLQSSFYIFAYTLKTKYKESSFYYYLTFGS